MAVGKPGQFLLGGYVLAGAGALRLVGDFQMVEQQLAELLRRVEVEGAAGQAVQVLLVGGDLRFQLQRVLPQSGDANGNPGVLHLHQQRHQRHLDLLPQLALLVAVDLLQQGVQQVRGNVGALAGEDRELRRGQAGGGQFAGVQLRALQQCRRGLAGNHRHVAEVVLGQQRQVVRALRLHQLMRQAGVQQGAGHRHAVPAQRGDPALQVVAHLGDARVLPEGRQLAQLGGGRGALFRQRQVTGSALLPAKRHARQRHLLGVAGTARQEQADRLLQQQSLQQPGAPLRSLHQAVVVGYVGQGAQRRRLPVTAGGRARRRRGRRGLALTEHPLDERGELEFL